MIPRCTKRTIQKLEAIKPNVHSQQFELGPIEIMKSKNIRWTTTLSLLLLLLLLTVHGRQPIDKEVCVLGGGAGGAYTAFELQQRGYDVVLI